MAVPITGYTELDLIGYTDKGSYSASATYVKNDLVHDSGNIWRVLVDNITGIQPSESANYTLFVGEPTNLMEAIIAPIEQSHATAAHSVGDQLIYSDVLYKVIAPIAIGDALTVNTNIAVARKIVYQISGIESDIATIESLSTASQAYAVGDYLFYDWEFYRVTSAIAQGGSIVTSGAGQNVEEVTVGGELKHNASGLPVGMVISFACRKDGDEQGVTGVTPTGIFPADSAYLVCDGADVSLSTYPKLAAYFASAYGNTYYFNTGGLNPGNNTFKLPDWSADYPTNGILCIKAK